MPLPFFYLSAYRPGETEITLDEDNSRHIVQVLRMARGAQLMLTDGMGRLVKGDVKDDNKKRCVVRVLSVTEQAPRQRRVRVGMSLLKNASRFEWFLEKAMEIGVTEIIPLLCERTERQHFRQERMQGILVSALLQSQQVWLPVLRAPVRVEEVMGAAGPGADRVRLDGDAGQAGLGGGQGFAVGRGVDESNGGGRYIAHCIEGSKSRLGGGSGLILIGPEGDFTAGEIDLAMAQGFEPVTLGQTRLRTETAGVVAATLMCIG